MQNTPEHEEVDIKLTENQTIDFLMAEYKESSSSFFKGVDIGISYSRTFLLINGILLASFGISRADNSGNFSLPFTIHMIISIFGIFISLMIYLIVPHYEKQLNNCARRCTDIEKIFNGKLFHIIRAEIVDNSRLITTTNTVRMISFSFVIFWVFILVSRFI